MKRFFISVLCAAVFFVGLGGIVDRAGANFKSDEKALELIGKARRAIGGDANIANVRSMTIVGQATKSFEVEGVAQSEQGSVEINFELPNKMTKSLKIGTGAAGANQIVDKKVEVFVMKKDGADNLQWKTEGGDPAVPGEGVRKFTIKKSDGTTETVTVDGKEPLVLRPNGDAATITSEDGKTVNVDGKQVFIRKAEALAGGSELFRRNELLRTTLSLLLTAPEGVDVSYTYAGEGNVDGASCDIVEAASGGAVYRLYLDKSSSLPRMMTFQGAKPFMIRIKKDEAKGEAGFDAQTFERQIPKHETAEFQIKFSDYRSIGGLQLPYRWTQTMNGKADETIDVTSYEINPANIADKFKELPTKVFVRTKKDQ